MTKNGPDEVISWVMQNLKTLIVSFTPGWNQESTLCPQHTLMKTYYHINDEDAYQRKSIIQVQNYHKAIKALTFKTQSTSKSCQWPHSDPSIINVNKQYKLIKCILDIEG